MDTILAKVSQVRAKHLESYKKLFDIFTKGGCNISNICNGDTKSIRLDTIEKICQALNCTPNDIFTNDTNK